MTHPCACGCGQQVAAANRRGDGERAVVRRFVHGHNRRGALPADVQAAIDVLKQHPDEARAFVRETCAQWVASQAPEALFKRFMALREIAEAAVMFVDASEALAKSKGVLPPEGDALVDATRALAEAVATHREGLDVQGPLTPGAATAERSPDGQ